MGDFMLNARSTWNGQDQMDADMARSTASLQYLRSVKDAFIQQVIATIRQPPILPHGLEVKWTLQILVENNLPANMPVDVFQKHIAEQVANEVFDQVGFWLGIVYYTVSPHYSIFKNEWMFYFVEP